MERAVHPIFKQMFIFQMGYPLGEFIITKIYSLFEGIRTYGETSL